MIRKLYFVNKKIKTNLFIWISYLFFLKCSQLRKNAIRIPQAECEPSITNEVSMRAERTSRRAGREWDEGARLRKPKGFSRYQDFVLVTAQWATEFY